MHGSSQSFFYCSQLFISGLKQLCSSQKNISPAMPAVTIDKFSLLMACIYLGKFQSLRDVHRGSCLGGYSCGYWAWPQSILPLRYPSQSLILARHPLLTTTQCLFRPEDEANSDLNSSTHHTRSLRQISPFLYLDSWVLKQPGLVKTVHD